MHVPSVSFLHRRPHGKYAAFETVGQNSFATRVLSLVQFASVEDTWRVRTSQSMETPDLEACIVSFN